MTTKETEMDKEQRGDEWLDDESSLDKNTLSMDELSLDAWMRRTYDYWEGYLSYIPEDMPDGAWFAMHEQSFEEGMEDCCNTLEVPDPEADGNDLMHSYLRIKHEHGHGTFTDTYDRKRDVDQPGQRDRNAGYMAAQAKRLSEREMHRVVDDQAGLRDLLRVQLKAQIATLHERLLRLEAVRGD